MASTVSLLAAPRAPNLLPQTLPLSPNPLACTGISESMLVVRTLCCLECPAIVTVLELGYIKPCPPAREGPPLLPVAQLSHRCNVYTLTLATDLKLSEGWTHTSSPLPNPMGTHRQHNWLQGRRKSTHLQKHTAGSFSPTRSTFCPQKTTVLERARREHSGPKPNLRSI